MEIIKNIKKEFEKSLEDKINQLKSNEKKLSDIIELLDFYNSKEEELILKEIPSDIRYDKKEKKFVSEELDYIEKIKNKLEREIKKHKEIINLNSFDYFIKDKIIYKLNNKFVIHKLDYKLSDFYDDIQIVKFQDAIIYSNILDHIDKNKNKFYLIAGNYKEKYNIND